jgi:integrase
MLEDMQLHNYSPHTIDGYLHYVAQCAKHFHASPDRLGPEDIRTSQLYLLQQHVSNRTPRSPQRCPSSSHATRFKALILAPSSLKHRAILAMLYATGVRVSELGQLKGTDIDSERMAFRVRQGKDQRDRFVMRSPDLLPLLRRYWKLYQLQSGSFPGTALPRRSAAAAAPSSAKKPATPPNSLRPFIRISCATLLRRICWKLGVDLHHI